MADPIVISTVRLVHIASGMLAFVVAPIALFTKKGGVNHRTWGKVYFWLMASITVTALILAAYRPVLFLALVAVFSFYSAFRAYRVILQKSLPIGQRAEPIDWVAALLTFGASFALATLGFLQPVWIQNQSIPAVAFGALGMTIAGRAMWSFRHSPQDRMTWWYEHMQGMLGSYIAAWSAFSVVTLSHYFGSAWYVWLWPTMIGVPGIGLYTAYYKRKFSKNRRIDVSTGLETRAA